MRRRRATGELAKAWGATYPQKKVGKETLCGSLFTLDSSLGLRCLSASQPTLTDEEEEEEENKYCPPAAHVYYHQRRTGECVWAHACTSFGRGQIPNALGSHPSHSSQKAPTHTRTHAHLPTEPPPQHSFPSGREIISCYSHVAASAFLYLFPACARAPVSEAAAAAAAAFPVASETSLHRQRWFSSGLLCLRFPR